MPKKPFAPSRGPKPIGPYSPAVAAGGLLFVSGQIALDPASGKLIEGDIEAQTEQALKNLVAVLEEARLTTDSVVKTTIYLADLGDFPRVNAVYGRYFTKEPPARATVGVAALPAGARVEIDAIATF
jgi:2-iminobutanoate/2-iminopropanoate deaminase